VQSDPILAVCVNRGLIVHWMSKQLREFKSSNQVTAYIVTLVMRGFLVDIFECLDFSMSVLALVKRSRPNRHKSYYHSSEHSKSALTTIE
jgi:hypothetical protein